ncbi:MAG: hypothetical protein LBF09_02435 [Odoribacteraceae bacterium]|jgi:hypothetical protein|nr:hypothetical protein [Odoribacteraceae bacterium]
MKTSRERKAREKKARERKLRERKHFAYFRYNRLRHEAYVEWIKSILALIDITPP